MELGRRGRRGQLVKVHHRLEGLSFPSLSNDDDMDNMVTKDKEGDKKSAPRPRPRRKAVEVLLERLRMKKEQEQEGLRESQDQNAAGATAVSPVQARMGAMAMARRAGGGGGGSGNKAAAAAGGDDPEDDGDATTERSSLAAASAADAKTQQRLQQSSKAPSGSVGAGGDDGGDARKPLRGTGKAPALAEVEERIRQAEARARVNAKSLFQESQAAKRDRTLVYDLAGEDGIGSGDDKERNAR